MEELHIWTLNVCYCNDESYGEISGTESSKLVARVGYGHFCTGPAEWWPLGSF